MRKFAGIFCLFLFCSATLNAQLCQGSLGDPIVNITFGAGPNPGAPLKAATTAYQYTAADCPNDGFYSVRNNTIACFTNSWHTLARDHTGDAGGYFMLVNASYQPSAFYIDTVKGLCGGTTYEFAAWLMNVQSPGSCSPNPILPNLTFSIERTDGTVLQTYNTNDLPQPATADWKQFGFFFTTPNNVQDVVLRIFNNAQGGCGNDIALDDITFRPCGPQLRPTITGNVNSNVNLCEGSAGQFEFNCTVSAGFNNPSFQWQQRINGGSWTDIPGETTTTLIRNFPANTNTGNYNFRLTAAEQGNMGTPQCRVASGVLSVRVAAYPVINLQTNAPVCENDQLTLNASDGVQYAWTGPAGFQSTNPSLSFPLAQTAQSGQYNVTVTNDAGCASSGSIQAIVNPNPLATTGFDTTTICEGTSVQMSAQGGTTYEWSPATRLSSTSISNPFASPVNNITYQVIVANQFGCRDTAESIVRVTHKPTANAGEDKWIVQGTSAQLTGTATGENLSISWTPVLYMNNPSVLQPVITPPHDTTYVLKVTSNDGCGEATDTVKVFVYKDVFVPNTFTPNGDGVNDTWYIPALSAYPNFELAVYDRWGHLVFQAKKSNVHWDGKFKGQPLAMGVYVYILDLKEGGVLLKGTVLITR
ncbi:gliding motility-associated C-terminal domain-containing protein [Terrimonas sp. NA20]|uniref:Gliding motility-associated C-terminal domain-containing protein n=1 Tax=Terrimonas ginsenosidimutans TaxID=2908004 RepID=A0ABS9KW98_9BACT|nr:gliding motility-associated C-terminal domain-containing protein [Terrimonas ginsenosidimutans]MCG2616591.1 gliding motility-associated C-terminal domain-containing protein [Terrimonas ginsenosidimutans]